MSGPVQVPPAPLAGSLTDVPTRAQVFAAATVALRTEPGLAVVALDEHGLFLPIPARCPCGDSGPSRATPRASTSSFRRTENGSWTCGPRYAEPDGAKVATRPALDPSCPAVIRVYDTSKQYGVHLALVDMPGASELTYSGGDNPKLRPHVCSIRKNEFACILDVDSAFAPSSVGARRTSSESAPWSSSTPRTTTSGRAKVDPWCAAWPPSERLPSLARATKPPRPPARVAPGRRRTVVLLPHGREPRCRSTPDRARPAPLVLGLAPGRQVVESRVWTSHALREPVHG